MKTLIINNIKRMVLLVGIVLFVSCENDLEEIKKINTKLNIDILPGNLDLAFPFVNFAKKWEKQKLFRRLKNGKSYKIPWTNIPIIPISSCIPGPSIFKDWERFDLDKYNNWWPKTFLEWVISKGWKIEPVDSNYFNNILSIETLLNNSYKKVFQGNSYYNKQKILVLSHIPPTSLGNIVVSTGDEKSQLNIGSKALEHFIKEHLDKIWAVLAWHNHGGNEKTWEDPNFNLWKKYITWNNPTWEFYWLFASLGVNWEPVWLIVRWNANTLISKIKK